MLEALVIAGIVAALLGSAALFMPTRHHGRAAGAWAAIWPVILAVAGSAVLAAAAAGVLYLLRATEGNLILGGTGRGAGRAALAPGHQELVAAGTLVLGVVHLPLRGLSGVRA